MNIFLMGTAFLASALHVAHFRHTTLHSSSLVLSDDIDLLLLNDLFVMQPESREAKLRAFSVSHSTRLAVTYLYWRLRIISGCGHPASSHALRSMILCYP